MIEPNYVFWLNSKPTDCDQEPEGPWAADVTSATPDEGDMVVDERSARYFACNSYTWDDSVEALNGEPGYVCYDGNTRHFVREYDVESIEDLKETAKDR